MDKRIRIWNGNRTLGILVVSDDGSTCLVGATGGAFNSTKIDIEFDPISGMIVDHSTDNPPIDFRQVQD